jgi:hypothetical protein
MIQQCVAMCAPLDKPIYINLGWIDNIVELCA